MQGALVDPRRHASAGGRCAPQIRALIDESLFGSRAELATILGMQERIAGGAVTLDTSSFPLVLVGEHGGLLEAQRIEELERLGEILRRRGRHAIVLDLTRGALVPEIQRPLITEQLAKRASEIVEKWAGLAVVVNPPLLDGARVGAFWIKAAPVPAKLFTSVTDASAWARLMLSGRASHAEIRTSAVPVKKV